MIKRGNISNYILGFLLSGFLITLVYLNTMLGLNPSSGREATRIYFVDNISSAHDSLINRFNREYLGRIEVVPVDLPFLKFTTNERKELLARSLRSKGDRIDVFAVDLIWVPRFARWAVPLDNHLTMPEREKLLAYALESCFHEGSLVASPFYIDVGLMYYRKDLVAALGEPEALQDSLKSSITWERFIRLAGQRPPEATWYYLFPAKNFEGLVCSFMEILYGRQGTIIQGDSVQLNTPAARRTLTMLVDMVHRYHMAPPEIVNFDEMQVYKHALENDAVFFRGWPGFLRHFDARDQYPDKFRQIEPAALPHFKGMPPASVFGGWNLMISRFSNHQKEAAEFIKFLLREENQKIMFEESGYLPVNRNVYRDAEFQRGQPDLLYYRNLLDNGIHRPFLTNYTQISDVLSYYVNLAIKRDIEVAEALERATRAINSQQVVIQ